MSKPRIAIAHLGCEKNRVDTEHMLGLLAEAGYPVSGDEWEADYVIVNTCSFIESARRESVRTLVEMAELGKKIIIAGCLAQHFPKELLEELPEAVALVGTGDYHKIVSVIAQAEQGLRPTHVSTEPTYIADETVPRYRTTNATTAYLKIAEGCDYACAFCIIPKLRGKQRSRPIESIVREAHQLADQGVRELILISQITTNYGIDLYGQPRLAELLYALGEVPVDWIRLLYAYPTGLTPKVLRAIKEVPNVLPYLDLPLQHSHPEILRAMNRPWQGRVNDRIIEQIRDYLPTAVLRTTFIVGFPGETEAHFQHLLDFTARHQFDHVGVFTFSPEADTPAHTMPHQIADGIKQERYHCLMALQQEISWQKNQGEIGKVVPVLVEEENPTTGEKIGRSARFAPEVDGVVYLSDPHDYASLGDLIPAKITAADPYDLHAEVMPQLPI